MPNKFCPKCGTATTPTKWDGTYLMDGSIDFSGRVCPKCVSITVSSGLEDLKDTTALSTQNYKLATECFQSLMLLYGRIDTLSETIKTDVNFCINNEMEISNNSIRIKTTLSGKPSVCNKESTSTSLSSLSNYVPATFTVERMIALSQALDLLLKNCTDSDFFALYQSALSTLAVVIIVRILFSK